MARRLIAPTVATAVVVVVSFIACSAPSAPGLSPSSSGPPATPNATPPLTGEESTSPAPSDASAEPHPTEPLTETFPRDQFSDPLTVDNVYFPLDPGMQWRWEGEVNVDDERVEHHVIFTVTDLTKVIDGVAVVVAMDEDYVEDELVEAEIAFFAQADDGTVWHLGQYPEEYEDGEFVDAPAWIAGMEDALAGITMHAAPVYGGRSYSEGWGPAVDWTDRARVLETGSETCVPLACYEDVIVIDEFNADEPDAHQLKYYAPGVGGVRVGWAGVLEADQEVLELVSFSGLDDDGLAAVRRAALALEAHAYEVSPDLYGTTDPAEQRN